MAAERRLFEEARGELVVADLDDVFESQRTATLVPCRHVVDVRRTRVRQMTTGVAASAAATRVHRQVDSTATRRGQSRNDGTSGLWLIALYTTPTF